MIYQKRMKKNKTRLTVGMVLTVWRSVKKPRPATSATPVSSVYAFRVVQMGIPQDAAPCLRQGCFVVDVLYDAV